MATANNQRVILIQPDANGDWHEVVVGADGKLQVGGISISGITIGAVDQGTGGSSAWKVDSTTLATSAKQDSEATLVGSVTETAPATDTASSGLNGRLQRIAQRLTTLLAGGLPAALSGLSGLKVEMINQLSSTIDSVTAEVGVAATSLGKAEDAVHSSGDTGVLSLAVRKDTAAGLAADGDYHVLEVDANGLLRVNASGVAVPLAAGSAAIGSVTVGAALKVISTAFENSKQIKATAGTLYGFSVHNKGTTTLYLGLYDAASKTGTVVNYWPLYAGDTLSVSYGDNGLPMGTGIFLQAFTDHDGTNTSDSSSSCWFTGRYV